MVTIITSRHAIIQWLEDRVPLRSVVDYLSKKKVPRHKHSFWYYFGGLTLFFFIVQIITGILLSFYYKPSPSHAYESVQMIVNEVPHGWFIRSIHSWSANFMVGSLFIHMFSVFLMKAYRKPRELMWISGVLLMFLVLAFGFTGYLLPWDTMAYFATVIGTEVPKTLPIIGDWGVSLLKGSDEVGSETLTRMYSIHIIILPLSALVIMSFHLLLNQLLGSSIPRGTIEGGPPIRFFPNFMYRDLIAWTIGLISLLAIAIMLPWGLSDKADPLASAPLGIKPEWYFLPLYQTLRMAPATVFTLNGELIVNVVVGIVATFWFAIPFIDRKANRGQKSTAFTLLGIVLILYLATTILLAYTT